MNGTMVVLEECEKASETSYFWYREALDVSNSIEETGGIKWWMLLCLLLAWVVVYFIIMRGVKSAGKVRSYNHALYYYSCRKIIEIMMQDPTLTFNVILDLLTYINIPSNIIVTGFFQ